jgi:LPS export ABC transporter protein LptC
VPRSRADRRRRCAWLAAALATTLGACSSLDQPPTTASAADSADQIGYGVFHYMTSDGVRRLRLEADSAYMYESSQRHRLFGIRVTFYGPEGRETSTLTAVAGNYDWRTGDMEARGDVVVVSPDQRRLETTVLKYERSADRIVGPEPFVWITPEQRVEGDAFTSDPEIRNVETTRARGSLGRVRVDQ